ncbi:MAG TPA: LamG domain-containing protein [Verrucomicrobiae bacterium]|nr:LamG domain-containing protein [Verrucomicrobiae bacterium]
MKNRSSFCVWPAALLLGFGALDLVAQQTVRPYAVEVAQDAPFGWWRLGDAPGPSPAADIGTGKHDGVYAGAVIASPGIPTAADGAGDFAGGHIDVPNPADFDSAGTALTVEAWVQPDSGSAFRWLVGKDDDNTSLDYLLGMNSGNSFVFITQGLGNVAAGPAQNFDGTTWYHVVGVQDPVANTVRLYVNGAEVANAPLAATGVKATYALRIGARGSDASQAIDGRIDEVAIYKTVLSDERILAHYNEGVTGSDYAAVVSADHPYGWWRLGDAPTGAGTEGADSGSGGNNGVYTGNVLAAQGIPGTSDGAADFAGGRLTMSNPTAFDLGGAEMTVEAWVQPDGSGSFRWLVSKDDDNTSLDYLLGSNPGGTFRFIAQGLSNDIEAPESPVIDGRTWHHVVGVIDPAAGRGRLYVDGSEVASKPLSASTGVLAVNPLVIGDRSGFGGNQTVDGRIDEVALYKTALSAERIRAHYLAGIFTTQVSLTITRQPSSALAAVDSSATFSVVATKQGTDLPLNYQWQRNGANISGATSNVYTIARVSMPDNGVGFSAIVSLAGGLSVTSEVATLTVIGAVGSYESEVTADQPFGWWRLGDAPLTALAADSGSSGRGGPYSGQILAAPGIPGAADGSADFAGGFIDIDDPAAFDFGGTNALTVEAWFQPDAFGGFGWMVGKDNNNTALDYLLGHNADGRFRFITQGLANDALAADPVFADGTTWYHVVGVQDPAGGTVKLYVNAVEVASVALAGNGVFSTAKLRIGARGAAADQRVDGRLDEVAIYRAALTQAQIDAHYTAGTQGPDYAAVVASDHPLGWWRFGDAPVETEPGPAHDSGQGAHAGAYSGNVRAAAGIPGAVDGGADFSGGRVTIEEPTAFDIGGTDLTVEAWVQPDAAGNFRWLVAKDDDNTSLDYLLGSNPNGQFRFITQGLANDIFAPTVPVINGQNWYHVVGVQDAAKNQVSLYINGSLAATKPIAATGITAVNPLVIGDRSGGGQTVDGRIDEVALYKSVLSLERIQAHYVAGTQARLVTERNGANLRLRWSAGELEQANAITGPWSSVPNAVSPFTVTPGAGSRFYRLRL